MSSEIIRIILISLLVFITLWVTIKVIYCYAAKYKIGLLEYLIDIGFCLWAFTWVFFSLWYYIVYSDPKYPTTSWQIIVVLWILITPFLMSFIKAELFKSFHFKKIKYFYGLHFIFLYTLLPLSYVIAQLVNHFILGN